MGNRARRGRRARALIAALSSFSISPSSSPPPAFLPFSNVTFELRGIEDAAKGAKVRPRFVLARLLSEELRTPTGADKRMCFEDDFLARDSASGYLEAWIRPVPLPFVKSAASLPRIHT